MIVLDARVLIAHVEPADRHHSRARDVLISVAGEQLAASPLTLAEFYVAPARAGRLDVAEEAIADLNVDTVALPDDAPHRLALLRSRTRLKLPDCCVLLAIEQTGAGLASFDEPLREHARAAGMRVVGS